MRIAFDIGLRQLRKPAAEQKASLSCFSICLIAHINNSTATILFKEISNNLLNGDFDAGVESGEPNYR